MSSQHLDSVTFKSVSSKRKKIFEKEVGYLMYGFGDVAHPDPESVELMEELLQDFYVDLCTRVHRICKRGPKTVHFLQALAHDPKKLHRARELLAMDKELKSARAVFDVNEMAKKAGTSSTD